MTPRRVLAAVAAALLLALFAWWLEVARPAREAARHEAKTRIAGDAELVRLFVDHPARPSAGLPAATFTLTRQADKSWKLAASDSPHELVADIRAVLPLVEALQRGRIEAELAPSVDALADRSQYGLDPPAVQIAFETSDGARGSLALGGPSPGTKSGYARSSDGRLVLVPLDLLHAADWDLAHFREKSVLGLGGQELDCVDVVRLREVPPGSSQRLFLSLDTRPAGNADLWLVSPPGPAVASRSRMAALQSKLTSLDAQGFGAEVPTDDELRGAGLLPPTAILRLRTTKGVEHVLEIGDESVDPDSVWARADGGPLVLVRVDLRWDALAPDFDWRENHPFTLDVQELRALSWRKGREKPVVLELTRGENGLWSRELPSPGPIEGREPDAFAEALASPQCGRFEDELIDSPELAKALYDFSGAGSAKWSAEGRDSEGHVVKLDGELSSPFLRVNDVFAAVRTRDGEGSTAVCIVKANAYDVASGLARALAERELAPAPRP